MEKAINTKISKHINHIKDTIADEIKKTYTNDAKLANLLCRMYEIPHFTIDKTDLQKRKRIKNSVPFHERCRAKKANDVQCTRRKKTDCDFCGTHIKGIPHGEISNDTEESKEAATIKVQVWVEEIGGIIYHLDSKGNVYDPQDIYENIQNPKVIARYIKNDEEYKILD